MSWNPFASVAVDEVRAHGAWSPFAAHERYVYIPNQGGLCEENALKEVKKVLASRGTIFRSDEIGEPIFTWMLVGMTIGWYRSDLGKAAVGCKAATLGQYAERVHRFASQLFTALPPSINAQLVAASLMSMPWDDVPFSYVDWFWFLLVGQKFPSSFWKSLATEFEGYGSGLLPPEYAAVTDYNQPIPPPKGMLEEKTKQFWFGIPYQMTSFNDIPWNKLPWNRTALDDKGRTVTLTRRGDGKPVQTPEEFLYHARYLQPCSLGYHDPATGACVANAGLTRFPSEKFTAPQQSNFPDPPQQSNFPDPTPPASGGSAGGGGLPTGSINAGKGGLGGIEVDLSGGKGGIGGIGGIGGGGSAGGGLGGWLGGYIEENPDFDPTPGEEPSLPDAIPPILDPGIGDGSGEPTGTSPGAPCTTAAGTAGHYNSGKQCVEGAPGDWCPTPGGAQTGSGGRLNATYDCTQPSPGGTGGGTGAECAAPNRVWIATGECIDPAEQERRAKLNFDCGDRGGIFDATNLSCRYPDEPSGEDAGTGEEKKSVWPWVIGLGVIGVSVALVYGATHAKPPSAEGVGEPEGVY